jgi:septum formation protein
MKEEVTPRLILASASPRRRELLALLGMPFTVMPSRYEEPLPPTAAISLPAFVTQLAVHKAQEVAQRVQGELEQGALVLAADTLVSIDDADLGVPLGKPTDAADACRMLRQLSGRTHRVYTGIAIMGKGNLHTSAVCTRVRFRELSDAMIADYVATGEPLDKAGAYGAQGYAAPFIESFDGDFFNVVGLPLCELGRTLESIGVEWWRFRQEMPPLIG